MSYSIIHQPVANSRQLYTGIKCHQCGQTSYRLEDIEAKRCPFCNISLTSQQKTTTGNDSKYTLYWGAGKKSKKAHWSVNGSNTLCMLRASDKVIGGVDNALMCGNCRQLKKRGIVR